MKSVKKILKRTLLFFNLEVKRSSNVEDDMIVRLKNDYLSTSGWNRSVSTRKSLDANGNELPWFTYSFLEFCKPRLKETFKVFEFGSGNSTLWFSKLVNSVVSVEHDSDWHALVSKKTQGITNLEYFQKNELNGEYSSFVCEFENEFDVIVIDGRDRVNCAINSLDALKDDGIIIWDNSEREEYKEGYDFLIKNNFKRIDFVGLGPINTYAWSTSVFYRNSNCFNI